MEQTVTIKLDIRDAHSLFAALLGVDARSLLHPAMRDNFDIVAIHRIDRAIKKLHLQLTFCVFEDIH